jgi:hypothetical protein
MSKPDKVGREGVDGKWFGTGDEWELEQVGMR